MLQSDAPYADQSAFLAEPGASWAQEIRATVRLAWPLVIAQLATMALHTTDVIMMGWLGPQYLAGGTLAMAYLYPFLMFGFGVLIAVSPMVAQAIGARQYRSVRRTTRQGLWVSLVLAAITIPLVLQAEWIFLMLGQEPSNAALAQSYLNYAVWLFIPALAFGVLRGLVSAHGHTGIILWITIAGIFVNAAGNYALMFGNFGFPRLELRGAGITTAFVNAAMVALLLLYVVTHRRLKRYAILVRFWKPDWPRFLAILRLGSPIGLMMTAEVGLFTAAAMLMGLIGTDELAAHAIAVQLAAIAFMVPLGISQATTIRVGLAYGRRHKADIGKAGWVSIGLATGFMISTCLLFWLVPELLIHRFLDPMRPENTRAMP